MHVRHRWQPYWLYRQKSDECIADRSGILVASSLYINCYATMAISRFVGEYTCWSISFFQQLSKKNGQENGNRRSEAGDQQSKVKSQN